MTCGGGGAYLSATSRDDDPLVLPPETLQADRVDPPPGAKFAWRAAYPTPEESRRMAVRVLDRLPSRNPGFVALMVAAQALLSYVFVASSRRSSSGRVAGARSGASWTRAGLRWPRSGSR